MENRRRISAKWLLLVIPLAFIAWCAITMRPARLEIGPETTYFDGPFTADGKIDYESALHVRLSADVKPEDNAAVLLIQAFGPAAIAPELRSRYFSWIGTPQLPDRGEYVVSQTSYCQNKIQGAENPGELNTSIMEELSRAGTAPWTRVECPRAAEWLDANQGPLKLIIEASQRSTYYSPTVAKEGLIEAQLTVQNLREAARLLVVRAMLRLGENDLDGAWSDLLACHRLSRLVGQNPQSILTGLVGMALGAWAVSGDTVLLSKGLSADQARKYQAEFAKLPSTGGFGKSLGLCERSIGLDATLRQFGGQTVDVNVLLRRMNQTYDKLAAAMKLETFAARHEALTAIEATVVPAKPAQDLSAIPKLLLNYRQTITNSVSDLLLSLLMPAMSRINISETRSVVRDDQVKIGLALAAFRAERGAWPKTLAELVPAYLDRVPLDQFTDKPFVYVPSDDGFVIYSVGPNGNDDAGISRDRVGDDIPFQVHRNVDATKTEPSPPAKAQE
ncbi:MAG: hypothetical protein WCJ09_11870 [Planctomycetota bacterium]